LGISSEAFYNLDPVELFWAYKVWREGKDNTYQERYEVARFLGILIRAPKLLTRLREVLGFFWEKNQVPKKQSVADLKKAAMALARTQGISKVPLKRKTVEEMEKERERFKQKRKS